MAQQTQQQEYIKLALDFPILSEPEIRQLKLTIAEMRPLINRFEHLKSKTRFRQLQRQKAAASEIILKVTSSENFEEATQQLIKTYAGCSSSLQTAIKSTAQNILGKTSRVKKLRQLSGAKKQTGYIFSRKVQMTNGEFVSAIMHILDNKKTSSKTKLRVFTAVTLGCITAFCTQSTMNTYFEATLLEGEVSSAMGRGAIQTHLNMLGGALSGVGNKLEATYNTFSPWLPDPCAWGAGSLWKCPIPASLPPILPQTTLTTGVIGPSPSPVPSLITPQIVAATTEHAGEIVQGLGKGASSILTGAQQTYNHRRFGDMVALSLNIIWIAFLMLEAFGSDDLYTVVCEIMHAENPQQKAFVRKCIQFLLSLFSTLGLAFSVIFQNLTVLTFATGGFILLTSVLLIGLIIYFMFTTSAAGAVTALAGAATSNPTLLDKGMTGLMQTQRGNTSYKRQTKKDKEKQQAQKKSKAFNQALRINKIITAVKQNIASFEQASRRQLTPTQRTATEKGLKTNRDLLSDLEADLRKLQIQITGATSELAPTPTFRPPSFTLPTLPPPGAIREGAIREGASSISAMLRRG